MSNPSRTPAQRLASAQNGGRSKGPRSLEGLARSAQNSVAHGLRSEELTILPHERPEEVVEHVERVLTDLGVEGYTEILVGKRIALRLLQQRRLEDIEARRLRAEVDARLHDTAEMKTVQLVEGTLTALGTMISVMSTTFPAEREVLNELLIPITEVAAMVEKVEDLGPTVFVGRAALGEALRRLWEASPLKTDAQAYALALERARAAATAVEQLVPPAQRTLERKREEVARQMPLPDNRDALLRRRYAADLERRLAADMRLLAALREQRAAAAGSGSLGQHPQVQVRLSADLAER